MATAATAASKSKPATAATPPASAKSTSTSGGRKFHEGPHLDWTFPRNQALIKISRETQVAERIVEKLIATGLFKGDDALLTPSKVRARMGLLRKKGIPMPRNASGGRVDYAALTQFAAEIDGDVSDPEDDDELETEDELDEDEDEDEDTDDEDDD